MDWSAVDYCDVFISSHSDGTHSLQSIHCWDTDAETHFWWRNKLRWTEGEQISVFFGWAVSLSTRCRDVGVFMCILESRSCFGSRENQARVTRQQNISRGEDRHVWEMSFRFRSRHTGINNHIFLHLLR